MACEGGRKSRRTLFAAKQASCSRLEACPSFFFRAIGNAIEAVRSAKKIETSSSPKSRKGPFDFCNARKTGWMNPHSSPGHKQPSYACFGPPAAADTKRRPTRRLFLCRGIQAWMARTGARASHPLVGRSVARLLPNDPCPSPPWPSLPGYA